MLGDDEGTWGEEGRGTLAAEKSEGVGVVGGRFVGRVEKEDIEVGGGGWGLLIAVEKAVDCRDGAAGFDRISVRDAEGTEVGAETGEGGSARSAKRTWAAPRLRASMPTAPVPA